MAHYLDLQNVQFAFDDLLYDDTFLERDQVVWRTTVTLTLP